MSASRAAIVVGSGPNGLAAAAILAHAGVPVTVLEAEPTIGGGTRSMPLTLPGFTHDVCSAVHPMAVASPCFARLPLADFGLTWIHSPAPLAHPLDDGTAAVLERDVDATAAGLGGDGAAYRALMAPLTVNWRQLVEGLLGPLVPPRHPARMARFGVHAFRSARGLADARFSGAHARALFAGIAAHAILPLEAPASAAAGLVLGLLAHVVGWPVPRGGAGAIADALAGYVRSSGGEILAGRRVTFARELGDARAVFFSVTPRQLARIGQGRLPEGYRRRLLRYRYGPAAFKLDWALSAPIPWRAPECARAATVHLGGTLEEIAQGEAAVAQGGHPDRPFVLLVQPSLFDDTRAPAGRHTAWAYCHVPNGSTEDMTERIERQVERFAPGFRDLILARHVFTPATLEQHNENYIGGDIVGGANDLRQLLARPVLALDPYAIPVRGWYLCSASTPPGGGVHGMAGSHAAHAALRSVLAG